MKHKLGVSGSTILSNSELFSELFWEGIDHIEIGSFSDETALKYFLELYKDKEISFGVHSPLFRNGSKYDLIQKVYYDCEDAWKQLEEEAEKMSFLGAEYVLVHFPYFKDEITDNPNKLIEEGLQRLNYIQQKYSIQLVCEPKLGFERSSVGINYLQNFSKETWEKYNIKLCIDIGDYIVATDDQIFNYLEKWKDLIKVVHLHNVHYEEDDYIWIPVHPSQDDNSRNYKIEEIIRFLSQCKDITFVFEHTPHPLTTPEVVNESYEWVKTLIYNR